MSISDMLTYAHCCALLLLSVLSICSLRLVWSVSINKPAFQTNQLNFRYGGGLLRVVLIRDDYFCLFSNQICISGYF